MNIIRTLTLHGVWQRKNECLKCPIRRTGLCCVFDGLDFSEINQPIEHMVLEPQVLLYWTGEHRRHLFTLREGAIKLVHYLENGTQRIVRLVGSGDLLGLEALLDQPYRHHAVALRASEVCVLPVALVRHLSCTRPRLCQELMRRWQEALNQADGWLTQYATGSARQRVARLLLSLTIEDAQEPVHLFGREDMGAILGLSTETVSRMISDLRRHRILRELKPNVFLCNKHVLRRIAHGE